MRRLAYTFCWILIINLLVSISARSAVAQVPSDSSEIAAFIDNWLSVVDAELEIDETVFQDLIEAPLNLNTCTYEDLALLPWLDPLLIGSFLVYRKERGRIENIDELATIPRWTPADQAGILPFVRIDNLTIDSLTKEPARRKHSTRTTKIHLVQQYSRRLDLSRGFNPGEDSTAFAGSAASIFTRLSAQVGNHIKIRLVADKDAGEQFVWHPATSTYGFDHVSGSIELKQIGFVKHIVAGDFGINTGQGLLFWRPYGNRRGAYPTRDPIKKRSGLMMAASREENVFHRGLALKLNLLPSLSLLAFHSQRSLDATVSSQITSTGRGPALTSFFTSGLHRTPAEMAKKDRQREIVSGGELRLTTSRLSVGITGYRSKYRFPFEASDALYKRFAFSASQLKGMSFHGSFQTNSVYAFAELARSYPGAIATMGGLFIKPFDRFQLLMVGRYYSPRYYAFHGHAFGKQRTNPRNEKGLYVGFNLLITPRWTLSGYADYYKFIWLRFGMAQPDSGHEHFLRIRYTPRKWLALLWQYRGIFAEKNKTFSPDANKLLRLNEPVQTHSLRYQLDFTFSSRLSFRFRAEAKLSSSNLESHQGYAFAQDITYHFGDLTKLKFRFSQFDSDGGLATLYFYEHDIQYRYSVAAFTGKGARNFILFKHHLNNNLSVEAKFSITQYERFRTIGSGLDTFSGKKIRNMRAQLIWQF